MCITNKLSTDINFNLSNECPMKINYHLGDDTLLTFYIISKIADDLSSLFFLKIIIFFYK